MTDVKETQYRLAQLPLGMIRHNPDALRKVDEEGEGFKQLAASIRDDGLQNPIVVRVVKDEVGADVYELVDGLHRFTACARIGLKTVPVNIVDKDQMGVYVAQIAANTMRIQTKPSEIAKGILRILALDASENRGGDKTMTLHSVANILHTSVEQVNKYLSLNKISDEAILKKIDKGEIGLLNAYSLATLPESDQREFMTLAMNASAADFGSEVKKRKSQISKDMREGAAKSEPVFSPVPKFRGVAVLKDELTAKKEAAAVIKDCKTPTEAFYAAIEWVLELDPATLANKKIEWEKARAETKKREEDRKKAAELAKMAKAKQA